MNLYISFSVCIVTNRLNRKRFYASDGNQTHMCTTESSLPAPETGPAGTKKRGTGSQAGGQGPSQELRVVLSRLQA